MRPTTLSAAYPVPIGVLLAGCGGGGSGCNVRGEACDDSPEYGGGIGDMGDPYEDERYSDYLDEQAAYWDQQYREDEGYLRQDGYQQGYDEGYQDGEDPSRSYDE
jgi:hypothetical protein